jgi:hypothetical protein
MGVSAHGLTDVLFAPSRATTYSPSMNQKLQIGGEARWRFAAALVA